MTAELAPTRMVQAAGARQHDHDDTELVFAYDRKDHFGSRRKRKYHVPGRVRSLSRTEPCITNDEDYQLIQKDDAHDNKIVLLGIGDARVAPKPPAHRPWTRGLHEISNSRHYQPVRMTFPNHWADDERDDQWYEWVWFDIRRRAQRFANQYFKFGDEDDEVDKVGGADCGYADFSNKHQKGDIPDAEHFLSWVNSLWLEGASQQFLYYAKQVARQDNKTGGWEALIQKERFRPLLVQGVIGRALQTSVFAKLLFGCTKDQEIMLAKQDEVTISMEGFQRTDLRSQTVRACLQGDILTPYFWENVDALALKLTKLLLPLIKLMDTHFKEESRQVSLRQIHQDLHHIAAEAAYMSIGIRQSRHVFRIYMPLPGQQWDLDQNHADGSIYAASKEEANAEDLIWMNEKRAGKGLPPLLVGGRLLHDGHGANSTDKVAMAMAISNPAQPAEGQSQVLIRQEGEVPWIAPRSRMAYVQLVMWPMLERYSHGGTILAPETRVVTRLAKSQVVYYDGLSDLADEEAEKHPTLDEYIRKKRLLHLFSPTKNTWLELILKTLFLLCFLTAVVAAITAATGPAGREKVRSQYLRRWDEFYSKSAFLNRRASVVLQPVLERAGKLLGPERNARISNSWNLVARWASVTYPHDAWTAADMAKRLFLPLIFTVWAVTWFTRHTHSALHLLNSSSGSLPP